MKFNDAFVIALAYPETIVAHAKEWYSGYLPYLGFGKKGYIKAGHSAIVIIEKQTGIINYFDFGRYVCPEPYGRVRSVKTDAELNIPFKAIIQSNKIVNLQQILSFFGTHPKLTHGSGNLYASYSDTFNYNAILNFISETQNRGFVRYAALKHNATNCARFVADVIFEGTTDSSVKKSIKKTMLFTVSPLAIVNVLAMHNKTYKVAVDGKVEEYKKNLKRLTLSNLRDRITEVNVDKSGTLLPLYNVTINDAQWIGGIGSGVWFKLKEQIEKGIFRFQRFSPEGEMHLDGIFKLKNEGFNNDKKFSFLAESNCARIVLSQNEKNYEFNYLGSIN